MSAPHAAGSRRCRRRQLHARARPRRRAIRARRACAPPVPPVARVRAVVSRQKGKRTRHAYQRSHPTPNSRPLAATAQNSHPSPSNSRPHASLPPPHGACREPQHVLRHSATTAAVQPCICRSVSQVQRDRRPGRAFPLRQHAHHTYDVATKGRGATQPPGPPSPQGQTPAPRPRHTNRLSPPCPRRRALPLAVRATG